MTTYNNWIESNMRFRLAVPSADYELYVRPYPFKEMSFQDAADHTAKLIYENHKKIYVSFSGGADSDFVVRCFHRNKIPFKVILVKTSGNEEELSYARKT